MTEDFLSGRELSTPLLIPLHIHTFAFVATVALCVTSNATFPQTLIFALASTDMDIRNMIRKTGVVLESLVATMPAASENHRLVLDI